MSIQLFVLTHQLFPVRHISSIFSRNSSEFLENLEEIFGEIFLHANDIASSI